MSTDEQDWCGWMEAAQRGDGAAYARLMKALVPVVRRMVARQASGWGDREDVVQDVLLSVHSVRHTYDPARPFLPWLTAIVRYRVADHARREMRRRAQGASLDDMPETIGAVETNVIEMDAPALRRAVAELPPGQRLAVELVKLREMSLAEAAQASGMSEGALKVAVHRAIKALKGMLER